MTDSGEESDNWVALNEHAGLGLPVAPGEHHRHARRLFARLGRPFLAHQVEYNRALLAELVTIRDSLVAQTIALGASTTEQFAALVERVDALGVRGDELAVETRSLDSDSAERIAALAGQIGAHLEVLGARLDGLGKHLEVLSALVEEHSADRDLVHAEVELGQQHAIEHLREACDGIRGELSDLRRQTEKRQRELERAIGRAR